MNTRSIPLAPLVGLRRDTGRNSAALEAHVRRTPIESPARQLPLFNPCDIYAHDNTAMQF